MLEDQSIAMRTWNL